MPLNRSISESVFRFQLATKASSGKVLIHQPKSGPMNWASLDGARFSRD